MAAKNNEKKGNGDCLAPPGNGQAPAKAVTGDKLIPAAMKAYGIKNEHVLKARMSQDGKQAVITTHGGKKVRFAPGDEVEPLTKVQLDGKRTKPPRYVAGKKKKADKE